jgi:hypothetical protein
VDISSLPTFPTRKLNRSAGPEKTIPQLSPRGKRILWELAFLVIFASMLWYLRGLVTPTTENPPSPPRRPFDFELVTKRFFKEVQVFASREEVEELLGPPSPLDDTWVPYFPQWMALAEHNHRDFGIPNDRFWEVWTDPEHEGKGVAILFAGGKVYYKAWRGFDRGLAKPGLVGLGES